MKSAGCVFADDEARVLRRWVRDDGQLDAWVRRRAAGEPLEHIVGRVEFGGLDLHVGTGVFVPRQRSLLLAAVAAKLVSTELLGTELIRGIDGIFVEACCGVAPIGAWVARSSPGTPVILTDTDERALHFARRNVPTADAHRGDLLAALPEPTLGRVAVVAAVTPYVPDSYAGLLPAEAVDHEPPAALFGGSDGLDAVRRLIGASREVLVPGGAVALEMHRGQVTAAAALADEIGYRTRIVDGDDGQTVVLVARDSRGMPWR
ncbi:N5-glutamine methyltransferase family protein [Gordonia liuliyuniae]|uniref:SAM-dependent methyltransferase n=1 Tax=Gordonia liuliyuniae TaxID=2911517 RepID=A0ABS9IUK6_9ACTN|nr:SAM-dependent methyltransferase [Gordonia liuliyuniae]MCF8589167.1 SAM-dependent methyltransferase [Gordonia liuliyuniae]